jgi:hypothetical protein
MNDYDVSKSERRKLVRQLFHSGHTRQQILLQCEQERLFPVTLSEGAKMKRIERDLAAIVREDLADATKPQDEARAEYIARQTTLMWKAVSQSKLDLARECSRDIALAQGLPVREPYHKEPDDMAEQMKTAFIKLSAKPAPQPSPANSDPEVQSGIAYDLEDLIKNKLH